MGLKAVNSGGNSSDMPSQEALEPGAYPARIVRIIDLGVQKRRPFKGKDKAPAPHILLTYELLDEFCLDEDGEELKDKPRWITERFPLFGLGADSAISTKRYKALDPEEEFGGDFSMLLGKPLLLTIVNNPGSGDNKGKVYNNVGGVSLMRKKDEGNAAPLVNDSVLFDLDDPDKEVWGGLEDWLKDLIKGRIKDDDSSDDEAEEELTKDSYEGDDDDW